MARILIVDDDDMERALERSFLAKMGHHLHFARDGEEALKILQNVHVDVVITDIVMPKLDGLSLIREIRRLYEGMEVVAVSGVSRDELGLAHDLGALETLVKPVRPDQLVEAVTEALARVENHA